MIEKDKDAIKYCSMRNSLLKIFLFKTLKTSTWEFEITALDELKMSMQVMLS